MLPPASVVAVPVPDLKVTGLKVPESVAVAPVGMVAPAALGAFVSNCIASATGF